VKPSLFGYARAESVEDALSLLAHGDGETRILAGGQSLVPLLNLRMAQVSALIDVNGLAELSFITREDGMPASAPLPVIAICARGNLQLPQKKCPTLHQQHPNT
jgi:hypothetical protein